MTDRLLDGVSMGATAPTIAAMSAAAVIIALPFGAAAAPHAEIPIDRHLPARADVTTEAVDERDRDDSLLDACPIDGDHDFEDSWGWARSGGRRHRGIDVGAERGTELYAVRDGSVDFKRSNLGGNAVWLETDDGDRFYYAHLDDFVGDDRAVEAGELIGYVGSTGNAGGPHLHFETHPSGSAENPYPHVVDVCSAPTPGELALEALSDRIQLRSPASASGSGTSTSTGAPTVHPV